MNAHSEPLPLDQVLDRIADVLVKLWPPERVILGMGTCKVVREILQYAPRAVLSLHPAELDRSWATFLRARDLARFNGLVDIVVRTPQQCKMIAAGIERATRIGWKGPTVLTFSDCLLGEDGAMLLASLLAQCTRLHELDLQGSYIGPTGSGFLAKSLRRLTNLRSLKLGHNELEAQGMKRLAAALTSLPSLTHLDVRSNEIGPGAHLTCFTGTKVQILTPEEAQVLSLLALLVQKYKYMRSCMAGGSKHLQALLLLQMLTYADVC